MISLEKGFGIFLKNFLFGYNFFVIMQIDSNPVKDIEILKFKSIKMTLAL